MNSFYSRLFGIILLISCLWVDLEVCADGSKDLYPSGVSGCRAFLRSSTNATENWPFPNAGTHYVYAKAGETITLASSAQNVGGSIKFYGVNGTLLFTNTTTGQISNRTQELAGPQLIGQTGGNRYTPIYYNVTQDGIYRVEFVSRGTSDPSTTVLANSNWSQDNNAGIPAWDVSVISSGAFIKGRVYVNVINLSNGTSSPQNNGFYGLIYALTKDGYIYRINNNGNNGMYFTFFVNNNGFVDATTQTPVYKSLNTTTNLTGRVHNPNNADQGNHITHKIFYTLPSTDLPTSSAGAVPSGNTWLKSAPIVPRVSNVKVTGLDGTPGQVSNKGGYIQFNADVEGNYVVEIVSAGSTTFPTRVIVGSAAVGPNNAYWDGKDGVGNVVPTGQLPVSITVQLQGAEVHFPFFDMEYNKNGTIIELLNHEDLSKVVSDVVYWDDTDITNASNGSNSNPKNNSHLPPTRSTGLSSNVNGHIWGVGGSGTSGQMGDVKSIDTWTFIKGEAVTVNSNVTVKVADLKISSITTDKNTLRIGDEITYTVKVKNDGPSDVVGSPFTFTLPPGFEKTGTPVFTGNNCGTESVALSYDATTNKYSSSLNLPDGCEVTYTFNTIVGTATTAGNNNAVATILRPYDVTDPDATNRSDASDPATYVPPTDPYYECANNGLSVACNNILTNTVSLIRKSDLQIEKTVSKSIPDVGEIVTFTLKVTNNGPHSAANIVITDVVPNGYTIKTINNGGINTSGTIKWTIASLAKDASNSVSFTATVLASGDYLNTASVTGDGEDPDPTNNTDTEETFPPVNSTYAVDDINITYKGKTVTGNVLTNDFDLEGNIQTVSTTGTITTSQGGTVILNADGTYTYTPKDNFIGEDNFSYTVCDNGNPKACDMANVTINVIPLPDPSKNNNVVANDDTGTTEKGKPVTGNVLTNDFDPDNDNLIINTIPVTQPAHGTVTLNSNGTYTYIPDSNFVGTDNFIYEVCDDGIPKTCDQATVTIIVLPENIKANYTFANDDVYYGEGKKNVTGNVLSNDFDPEGNQQLVNTTPVSGPSNGTLILNSNGTFTYTPNNGFIGTDHFIYEVCDNGTPKACDRATAYIIVNVRNYWHGTVSNEWANTNNWTAKLVPASGEDIEFATSINNGATGSGNGAGTAVRDLYLDTNRIIGNLINNSDVNLVVTTENQLTINGTVQDNNPNKGTIIVKTSTDKPTGTLIFSNPSANASINSTVEFYNKAYECSTCGFYKRQWQYFGIPVKNSVFPSTGVETINQWVEPYNGDKWRPAPYTPDTELKAFKGYEMTNNATTLPDKIYSYIGSLNIGDAIVPVTKTSNVNYSGMNLLSNSYTGAIPISTDAITFDSGLLEETVYLFNTGTRDQWRKLNGSTETGISGGQYQAVPFHLAGQGTLPDRILSMHAFMLNALKSGQITLKYDKLGKNELINQLTWRSLKSDSGQLPHIVMDVIGNTSADRVWLFENPSTSANFDNGWDGYKLLQEKLIQVYVSGGDKNIYQIATVPKITGTIFGVKVENDQSYKLNMSVTSDIESRSLLLRDLSTGYTYPIINNAEYTINRISNSVNNGFEIISANSVSKDSEDSSLINITANNKVISVSNLSEVDCTATTYDLTGRMLTYKTVRKYSTEFFTGNYLPNGVYIVKVTSNDSSVKKTSRVLVK
ncbi:Ig-like domain-containing protein [Dysgonomonas sp.]